MSERCWIKDAFLGTMVSMERICECLEIEGLSVELIPATSFLTHLHTHTHTYPCRQPPHDSKHKRCRLSGSLGMARAMCFCRRVCVSGCALLLKMDTIWSGVHKYKYNTYLQALTLTLPHPPTHYHIQTRPQPQRQASRADGQRQAAFAYSSSQHQQQQHHHHHTTTTHHHAHILQWRAFISNL